MIVKSWVFWIQSNLGIISIDWVGKFDELADVDVVVVVDAAVWTLLAVCKNGNIGDLKIPLFVDFGDNLLEEDLSVFSGPIFMVAVLTKGPT